MINFNPEALSDDSKPKREKMETPQMSKEQILSMIEKCQNTIKELQAEISALQEVQDMHPVKKAAKMANLMLDINIQESNIEYWQDGLEGK